MVFESFSLDKMDNVTSNHDTSKSDGQSSKSYSFRRKVAKSSKALWEEKEDELERERMKEKEILKAKEREKEICKKEGIKRAAKPSESTMFFFLNNFVDEPLGYGFYSVPRQFVHLPTFAELKAIDYERLHPFTSYMTHVVYLDRNDERLESFRKEAMERIQTTRSKRFHGKLKELLVVLKEHFPYVGPYAALSEIEALTTELRSLVIPIGALKRAGHEELALLFKLVCEDANIDCRIVRGRNPAGKELAWAFAREDPAAKWIFVNVVEGTAVVAANSVEANDYVIEGGSGNGVPQEGSFPASAHMGTKIFQQSTNAKGLITKPNAPYINCECSLYEEVSPMVTCTGCKGNSHGPCYGWHRLEELPENFKCNRCAKRSPMVFKSRSSLAKDTEKPLDNDGSSPSRSSVSRQLTVNANDPRSPVKNDSNPFSKIISTSHPSLHANFSAQALLDHIQGSKLNGISPTTSSESNNISTASPFPMTGLHKFSEISGLTSQGSLGSTNPSLLAPLKVLPKPKTEIPKLPGNRIIPKQNSSTNNSITIIGVHGEQDIISIPKKKHEREREGSPTSSNRVICEISPDYLVSLKAATLEDIHIPKLTRRISLSSSPVVSKKAFDTGNFYRKIGRPPRKDDDIDKISKYKLTHMLEQLQSRDSKSLQFTCFDIFFNEVQEELKRSSKEILPNSVIAQVANERWKVLPDDEKIKYIDLAHCLASFQHDLGFDIDSRDYQLDELQANDQEFILSKKRSYSEETLIREDSTDSEKPSDETSTPSTKKLKIPFKKAKRRHSAPITTFGSSTTTSSSSSSSSTAIATTTTEPPPKTPKKSCGKGKKTNASSESSSIKKRRKSSHGGSGYDINHIVPIFMTPPAIAQHKAKEVHVPRWRPIPEPTEPTETLTLAESNGYPDQYNVEMDQSGEIRHPEDIDEEEDDSDEYYLKLHQRFEEAERNRLPLPIQRRHQIHMMFEREKQQRPSKRGAHLRKISISSLFSSSSPSQRMETSGSPESFNNEQSPGSSLHSLESPGAVDDLERGLSSHTVSRDGLHTIETLEPYPYIDGDMNLVTNLMEPDLIEDLQQCNENNNEKGDEAEEEKEQKESMAAPASNKKKEDNDIDYFIKTDKLLQKEQEEEEGDSEKENMMNGNGHNENIIEKQ